MEYSEKGAQSVPSGSAQAAAHEATTKNKPAGSSRYLKLRRLPTLQEVLDRRTRPPLDLFCFYIFLQRESSEDALDFWLDVQQHENLCKAYFKDLKRSGRSVDDDWPEFGSYVRRNGSYLSPIIGELGGPGSAERIDSARRSSDLALERAGGQSSLRASSSQGQRDYEYGMGSSGLQGQYQHPSTSALSHTSGEMGQFGGGTGRGSRASIRGWSAKRNSERAPTYFARDRAIEKHALVESAERIYLRYLLPQAEREIYLPPALRLTNFPVSTEHKTSPMIPDLFHAQKLYVFRALEQDAFPRFLRAKAFGNLTPTSALARLIAGLVVLWGAFVLGFTFIFLDWSPKARRLWVIIPFFFAANLLLAAYYSLDPLLALFFQSETTPFRLIRIRETYVRKLILLRALWIECLAVVITAIFTLIFVLVPGHRL